MALLHQFVPGAKEAAFTALARAQGRPDLQAALAGGHSLHLDDVLAAWQPEWSDVPVPAQMGPMAKRLRVLTYCVFVGIWHGGVGCMLRHPDLLPKKSVTTAYSTKEDDHWPRAFLSVGAPETRVLVPFPQMAESLTSPTGSHTFAEMHEALDAVLDTMVERVNLVTPAVLALLRP